MGQSIPLRWRDWRLATEQMPVWRARVAGSRRCQRLGRDIQHYQLVKRGQVWSWRGNQVPHPLCWRSPPTLAFDSQGQRREWRSVSVFYSSVKLLTPLKDKVRFHNRITSECTTAFATHRLNVLQICTQYGIRVSFRTASSTRPRITPVLSRLMKSRMRCEGRSMTRSSAPSYGRASCNAGEMT